MTAEGGQGSRVGRTPIDARTLVRLARKGGAIGLAHFRRAAAEGKSDATMAAAADREIEALLRDEILAHFPEMAILRADLQPVGDPHSGWAVAIDPIDGTDAYVAGLPTWSISLAVLDRGRPVAGAVYLPAFDDLYVAYDGVLQWNGDEIPRGGADPRHEGFVLAYSEFHRRHLLGVGARARKMRAVGSTAYHMSLVARGAAQAAIIGRVHVWDLAAGAALLHAVGGELVHLRTGQPVDLRTMLGGAPSRDILVAARQGAIEGTLRRIRRR
jgi:fructose-1,6-bisphosphatase/inositol monophosphatase family enzyme